MSKQKLLRRSGFFIMAALAMVLLSGCEQYIVLDPKGPVAEVEYRMIVISVILCAIVVIPVLAIFAYVVYRFRDKPGNNAPYTPHWDDNKVLEIIWWGVPILIIGILGYFTARDTFALANPPKTEEPPMVIQVSSMDWKWVFHYPEQNIATVNEVHIPVGKRVEFQVTADNAPMNSFWIPQIAGMTYTMPGMAMKLGMQADHPGEYFGSGANFTGKGFAHMQFKAIAEEPAKFEQWVTNVKQTKPALTRAEYEKLYSVPGLVDKQEYSSYPKGIFEERVMENGGDNHTGHFEHKKAANGEKSQESMNK